MAIQLLNLSIDSIDFKPMASTDLSEFNDLNTITEYLAEVVLGHSNIFPEAPQKEQKQAQLQKHLDVKLYVVFIGYTEMKPTPLLKNFQFPLDEQYSHLFFKEINPPPPKYQGNLV
ncbi:MAG: hypothetical protein V4450_02505 [Bacteroidota bacterium]